MVYLLVLVEHIQLYEIGANRRIIPLFMRFVCNLTRIMLLFDFGRNYAKNYASIIRQGLPTVENSMNGKMLTMSTVSCASCTNSGSTSHSTSQSFVNYVNQISYYLCILVLAQAAHENESNIQYYCSTYTDITTWTQTTAAGAHRVMVVGRSQTWTGMQKKTRSSNRGTDPRRKEWVHSPNIHLT